MDLEEGVGGEFERRGQRADCHLDVLYEGRITFLKKMQLYVNNGFHSVTFSLSLFLMLRSEKQCGSGKSKWHILIKPAPRET